MNTERNIMRVAIVILLLVLVWVRACSPTPPIEHPTIVRVVDTTYIYKEIKVEVKVPVPYGVPVDRPVPMDVDTAAILKDYYSVRYYKDSVAIDSIGQVVIEDSVSQNKILYRKTYGDYKIPYITETTTITMPPERKTQLYAGFSLGAPAIMAGPQLTLKTKNDQLYQVGAGVTTVGPYVGFGMAWKIKLK